MSGWVNVRVGKCPTFDITGLMALGYTGDVSTISQMHGSRLLPGDAQQARAGRSKRESKVNNLDGAYNCALQLEMIRHDSQKKDQEQNVRAVEAEVNSSALKR